MEVSDVFEGSVKYCKGVGPYYENILAKKNVVNIYDLINYIPKDYEDRSKHVSIKEALKNADKNSSVLVEILAVESFVHNFRNIPKLIVSDGEDLAEIPVFSGRLTKKFKQGVKCLVAGKFRFQYRGIQCALSEIEVEGDAYEHFNRIVPIYPLTEGLSQKRVRNMMRKALDSLTDRFPYDIPVNLRRKYGFDSYIKCYEEIHFPSSFRKMKEARDALVYEEFFAFQLYHMRKATPRSLGKKKRYELGRLSDKVLASLPFKLSSAQERVLNEIKEDLLSDKRLFRLLQGDVGSGKTIVALLSSLIAAESSCQTALLVPTEILARQHFETFKKVLKDFDVSVDFLSASLSKDERGYVLKRLREGKTDIIIGTHALFSDDVVFNSLSFLIVDEQQRFGLRARNALLEKGEDVDFLLMTATPIPRSLSQTLFGELSLSIIDELPPNRARINTRYLKEDERAHAYKFLRSRLKKGEQAYVVFPAIEENDEFAIKSLNENFKSISSGILKEYRTAYVHGKISMSERDEVMRSFKEGEIDVLFATSVIEVGIDNPNATTIIVEGAERFGLSQLHQIRGRVGRGNKEGYCYLVVYSELKETLLKRMEIMTETNDGFKISETDLELRGPGEFLGVRQSGLPEFKIADIIGDIELLKCARKDALDLFYECDFNENYEKRVSYISMNVKDE